MSHCEGVLRAAKRIGACESEAVYSKKRVVTVRITDSEIAEVKETVSEGISARLVQGKRMLSIKASDPDKISQYMEDGQRAARYLRPKEFWRTLPQGSPGSRKIDRTYDSRLDEIRGGDAADVAQTMINEAMDCRIAAVSGSLNIVSDRFQIANSHGLELEDSSTYISGVINADSKSGPVAVSGIGQDCCRTLGGFDAGRVGQDARAMCIGSANPKRTESGEYSVILEPYSVGEIMAFVLASNFSFRALREKRSCFSGRQNSAVAPDILNISDDPFVPDSIGAKAVDDEGVRTKRLSFIKGGIFSDAFSDLEDAYRFDGRSSGNASRPGSPMGTSAEPDPIAAPHNIRIEGRTCKRGDMIKDVKRGIIVGRLWYTYAMNPTRGDFSCTARSGIQIVENGEVKNPGKPVRIVYNLRRLLENTANIADDARSVQQWDSLPSIVPTVQFDGVPVRSI